jgi:para-aminobenzoate synthetase component 1
VVGDFVSRHPASAAETIEFTFYDTVLAFDHLAQELSIYSAGLLEAGLGADKALAQRPPASGQCISSEQPSASVSGSFH